MAGTSVRLDKLLVDRGLVPSRERAQALILAARVLVNENKVVKAGQQVAVESEIRLLGDDIPYVGRGGLKLEHALHTHGPDVSGMVAMDVGASTGGFTDCLLQHGAKHVYAVDVGYGQLAWKLRSSSAKTFAPSPPNSFPYASTSRRWTPPSSRSGWCCRE